MVLLAKEPLVDELQISGDVAQLTGNPLTAFWVNEDPNFLWTPKELCDRHSVLGVLHVVADLTAVNLVAMAECLGQWISSGTSVHLRFVTFDALPVVGPISDPTVFGMTAEEAYEQKEDGQWHATADFRREVVANFSHDLPVNVTVTVIN